MWANSQASMYCIPTKDMAVGRQRLQDLVFFGKRLDVPDLLECIENPDLLGNKVVGHIEREQIGFDRIRFDHIEFDDIGFGRMSFGRMSFDRMSFGRMDKIA
ncbi:hypothetical protein [Brevibacillus sp. FIR094]|uniref:hypothetical protein n=1 Tax=Brevibacillus sp. FIR094 TaxID=3134809 RepID=UPI003D1F822B